MRVFAREVVPSVLMKVVARQRAVERVMPRAKLV
jgi:hypothetical protein